MKLTRYRKRLGALAAVALLAGSLSACDSLLEVTNPGAVLDDQLSDSLNVNLLTATVVNDFQEIYDDLARNGAWFSDEMLSGHNFVGYREWDGRIVLEERGELHDVYTVLHQARFSADSLSGRFQQLFPEPNGTQNLALGRMRAYGGYTYVMLGEYFCESPLMPDEGAVTSDEILRIGITRFEQAIAAASASKSGTGAVSATRADSIINLARVGAARAYLDLGDKAKAIEFASQVPAGFEFRSFYSENKEDLENIFYGASIGANQNLGVDVKFRGLNDTRVQHTATSRTGHNGATPLFRPYQAPSFSEWTPSPDTTNFQKNTSIRFASGLEAQYILAEAGAMTGADLLAFLNSRREVGGQAPLASLPADPQAEVRDQRRRDFFLDGHRVGDLRRYLEQYNINEFPQGTHPDPFLGSYGSATCFVPALNEKLGNPGY